MEQLITIMCDTKQAYTQQGGLRPFGVSLLYMGWDAHHGFQLYQSDPSGNYGGWKAACIGANGKVLPASCPPALSSGFTVRLLLDITPFCLRTVRPSFLAV